MAGAIKEASAVWQNEGHAFQVTVPSGATLRLDSEGVHFRPAELLMVGLAGCTGMDVIDILRKKRQNVTGFEVRVKGEQAADHPRKFVAIEVNYIVSGHNIDREAVRRAVELSETKYCSVMATLRPVANITTHFEVREADAVSA
ncbi:MAG: OsmC family protein [Anaerolineales bacterium]|nr:OsmC family protein [Anaerolineales bacterium]